jgi:hypothetical protein
MKLAEEHTPEALRKDCGLGLVDAVSKFFKIFLPVVEFFFIDVTDETLHY